METPEPVADGVWDSFSMRCRGCGAQVEDPLMFTCPAATPGDDVDHLLQPGPPQSMGTRNRGSETQTFLRFRETLAPYRWARARGLSDADIVEQIRALDAAIEAVDGTGFAVTPATGATELARAIGLRGTLVVKSETANVSGSHKGRHLFGLMLHLLLLERADGVRTRPPLAIASCGNAALAAAVIASAAHWPLDVFVPPDAPAPVLDHLALLGARVQICNRRPGERGDPCFERFLHAVENGALPFGCQGPANGLTIEGGTTLGLELAEQLTALHGGAVDHLILQVGGGAFATATMEGLRRAVRSGMLDQLPRLHAIQTTGAAPLARAMGSIGGAQDPRAALRRAVQNRSSVMWPWEEPPRSVASGILDDETYDWQTVVADLVETGGTTPVVSEHALERAHREAAKTGTEPRPDHTGTSGLAGLIDLIDRGVVEPDSSAAVVFSGAERAPAPR